MPTEREPPRRPSQPHHSGSTSSTDFASLEQRESHASSASQYPRPVHNTPPPAASLRRPSAAKRGDSAASSAPSTAPSRASTATKKGKKPERPRPSNLAGPTLQRVPESYLRVMRADSEGRTPGSTHSGPGMGGEGEGGSFFSPSLSGDEAAAGKSDGGGAKKPLWAIGGVFPKNQKRRRSTVDGREKGVRRGSVSQQPPPQNSGSGSDGGAATARTSVGRGGARRAPAKLPYVPERGDSISATRSDSTGSDETASDTDVAPGLRAGTGDGVGSARTDPFEDLGPTPSRRSPRASAPLDEGGGEGGDPGRQLKDEMRSEVGDEVEARLKKVHSGSSRTVAGDQGEKDGEKGQHEGEEGEDGEGPPEGAEAGRGGPNVGGELDQSAEQWAEDVEDPEDLPVRNWWGTVRYALREPLAEFLGTLVLVCIGVGADCQTKISLETMGAYQSMNWSWGFGVMIALYIAGGISGGHTNPAVTITLAIFRGFPWKMVPRYIFAQVLGAFCGALIIYGNYRRAIGEYDSFKLIQPTDYSNASAPLFITAPSAGVSSTIEGFCQEILAGGILSIAVLALGDENNAPPGAGLGAIVLGFVVVAIGMSNGWISGYAINPARDLGPRLALWTLGYGKKLWYHDHWWWLIGPILGPLVGSIAGALAYDLCIFTGPGSPVNFTGHEVADAMGLYSVHNMVWIALSPEKRRERRFADNPRSQDDLAENGLATTLARRDSARILPGRSTQQDKSELRLENRFKKAQANVLRQEERSRQRERGAVRNYQRSLDRARAQSRQSGEEDQRGHEADEGQEDYSPSELPGMRV
ncbi:hypothetical protein JCM8208_001804 [Rhodotorula glutinis]